MIRTCDIILRLHNFIKRDSEMSKLQSVASICHEDDTQWRRGLRNGEMPDPMEMVMVANLEDRLRPGRGSRSDLTSDRRVKITQMMKYHKCKRPPGSAQAQAIRKLRPFVHMVCGDAAP